MAILETLQYWIYFKVPVVGTSPAMQSYSDALTFQNDQNIYGQLT